MLIFLCEGERRGDVMVMPSSRWQGSHGYEYDFMVRVSLSSSSADSGSSGMDRLSVLVVSCCHVNVSFESNFSRCDDTYRSCYGTCKVKSIFRQICHVE
jgi:hypothetical protein